MEACLMEESKSSSESEYEYLAKLIDRLKHDVEHFDGANLWAPPEVIDAMYEESDDLEYTCWRVDCLKTYMVKRVRFLNYYGEDPLWKSTSWDLSRFWRFCFAIQKTGVSGLQPQQFFEEFMNRNLLPSVLQSMKEQCEDDKVVTLEEVTRHFHLFIQIEENGIKKKKALRAILSSSSRNKRPKGRVDAGRIGPVRRVRRKPCEDILEKLLRMLSLNS